MTMFCSICRSQKFVVTPLQTVIFKSLKKNSLCVKSFIKFLQIVYNLELRDICTFHSGSTIKYSSIKTTEVFFCLTV